MTTFTNYFARAGPLAIMALAAAMVLPINGTVPANLIRSSSYSASTDQKKTAMRNYGNIDGFPAIWDDGATTGYVLFNEKVGWTEKTVVELRHTVAVMTKDAFDKAFPNLPPLPNS